MQLQQNASSLAEQPGQNITRFQACATVQKLARFGCSHESVRNWNRMPV